jgi:hypothetical protein
MAKSMLNPQGKAEGGLELSGGILSRSRELQKDREATIAKDMAEREIRLAQARLKEEELEPTPENLEIMLNQMRQEEMDRRMNEAAERQSRAPLLKGGQTKLDANKDGDITAEDFSILRDRKGRKATERFEKTPMAEGGISAKDHIGAAFSLLEEGEYTDREAIVEASRQLEKATSKEELEDLKFIIKNKFARSNENFPEETKFIPKDLKNKIDNFKLGDSTYKTFVEDRNGKAEGSMLMPVEGMPVDTYPNIPEDEMDEALDSQLPDDEMEEDYIKYVMDESLNDDEQIYLAGVLQDDDRLSDILDKVITTASEFSGAGEVDGPGTGVSDSIPARLSDGEFVFTKKATDQIGSDVLQKMMDDAERAYDGGKEMKAEGGMMEESQISDEINKLMMGANRMPSLQ